LEASLLALWAKKQERPITMLPAMGQTIARLTTSREVQARQGAEIIARISAMDV
jgi:hypothetical protein